MKNRTVTVEEVVAGAGRALALRVERYVKTRGVSAMQTDLPKGTFLADNRLGFDEVRLPIRETVGEPAMVRVWEPCAVRLVRQGVKRPGASSQPLPLGVELAQAGVGV